MLRGISIGALIALLVLLLYVPATLESAQFDALAVAQHARDSAWWGEPRVAPALAAARAGAPTLLGGIGRISPPPRHPQPHDEDAQARPVRRALASIRKGLRENPYVESIDALLRLAHYRMHYTLLWWPLSVALLAAACIDGLIMRVVRSHDFRGHNPEMLGLCALGVVCSVYASLIAMLLPISLPPLLLASTPLVGCWLFGVGVSHYHRMG